MYEHGITVTYRLLQSVPIEVDAETGATLATRITHSEPATVDLPGWCAGEPRLAVTLYLFGSRDDEGKVWLDDWQPRDPRDELCTCPDDVVTCLPGCPALLT